MILGKDDILNADDLAIERVPVPEWGEGAEVCVRVLKGHERDKWERSLGTRENPNMDNIRARFAVLCVCDESGQRLFRDDDVVKLADKSGAALGRIFTAAQELNGYTADEAEEMEKNSESGQSDNSGST